MVIIDNLNFEGCGCPWCSSVVVLPIVYDDHHVIGTCPECGNMYKAIPHAKYCGAITMLKYQNENLDGW